MTTEHKMKIRITKSFFYNDETYFGIFAGVPVDKSQEEDIKLNKFNSLSLRGNTRPLRVGNEYIIVFDGLHPNNNPRFDDYYQIKSVEPEKLLTTEDQDNFLKAVITEGQFNILKEAYPEVPLVDYILKDKIDVSKTKGIKEKSLANIKEQVKENASLSLLIAKLDTLGLTTSNVKRIMEHFTDGQIAIDAINKNIYSLCGIKGFGFSTIDQIAMRRGDSAHSSYRINACFDYILKSEAQSGHTWMERNELVSKAKTLLRIEMDKIEDSLDDIKNKRWLYSDDDRVSLVKIRNQEKSINKNLGRIHTTFIPNDMYLTEERLSYFESRQGFDFTEKQRDTILKSSRSGVSVINGSAGSGKSTIIKGIIASSGYLSDEIMTCALSGKASNVLSSKGMPSGTIHRVLKYDGRGFKYDGSEEECFLPYSLIIVDEMSMVDVSLFNSLLKAVKSGSRLVLVGDNAQLSSIGYGDVLQNMLETSKFPSYELTEIHRQAGDSGVLELATLVRRGEYEIPYNSSGKSSFGKNKDQSLVTYSTSQKDSMSRDSLRIVAGMKDELSDKGKLLDFQVLTPNRKSGKLSSDYLNIEIQKILNGEDKPSVKRGNFEYKQGDKVIALGNMYGVKSYKDEKEYKRMIAELKLEGENGKEIKGSDNVFNGSMGIVESVDSEDKLVFVSFEDVNGLIVYKVADLDKISLAYAITIHRSQGSQYGKVLMCLDFSAYMLLSMNLVYTAVTRSSDKCIVLAESNALSKALKTKSNNRRTFLKEFLNEE